MKIALNILICTALFSASASATALRHRKLAVETTDNPIDGQYIIELVPSYNAKDKAVGLFNGMINKNNYNENGKNKQYEPEITAIYDYVLNGFAVKNFPESKLNGFLNNPHVKAVYQDGVVTTSAIQSNPIWGLDRIDDTTGFDQSYEYFFTGAGVDIFILDTPVNNIVDEFGSRFGTCTSFTSETCDMVTATDDHGTHVMGTAGGRTYGVAKGATLHSVRVLENNGYGADSGLIAAINHVVGYKVSNPNSKVVANLSLRGSRHAAVDDAVNSAVAQGVTMILSAGNNGDDACNYSPYAASAIIVGAVSKNDSMAPFSNFGTCVDIFAPGVDITSRAANGEVISLSGTSMAAPFVAGVAALYLEAGRDPNLIITDATSDVLTNIGSGSPNKMLYTGSILRLPPGPKPAPAPAPKPGNGVGNGVNNGNGKENNQVNGNGNNNNVNGNGKNIGNGKYNNNGNAYGKDKTNKAMNNRRA